jgi:hypothetical protein
MRQYVRAIEAGRIGDGEGDGDDTKLDSRNHIIIDLDLLFYRSIQATFAKQIIDDSLHEECQQS